MKKTVILALLAITAFSSYSHALSKVSLGVKGEELLYNKKEFKVKAGDTVELTFVNSSKAMPHNVVILKIGSDPVAIGNKGLMGGAAKDWIPQDPAVLFHTKLVQGGKTEVLKFKAPTAKGKYPFVCTFPGHPGVMNGIMIVE